MLHILRFDEANRRLLDRCGMRARSQRRRGRLRKVVDAQPIGTLRAQGWLSIAVSLRGPAQGAATRGEEGNGAIMWTIDQIEHEWIGANVAALARPADRVIEAFDRVESVLGRDWMERSRGGVGESKPVGTATPRLSSSRWASIRRSSTD